MLDKIGMYREMPTVQIGDIRISQMTNKEKETKIWIDCSEVEGMGEGMEIDGKIIENEMIDIFNKHF